MSTEDMKDKLLKRRDAIKAEFEKVQKADEAEGNNIRQSQQKRVALKEAMLRLQGEYKQVDSLLNEVSPEVNSSEAKPIPTEAAVAEPVQEVKPEPEAKKKK
jgi:predicted ribonuclease toxin of YeeF-YezG toxin-antitoxin module